MTADNRAGHARHWTLGGGLAGLLLLAAACSGPNVVATSNPGPGTEVQMVNQLTGAGGLQAAAGSTPPGLSGGIPPVAGGGGASPAKGGAFCRDINSQLDQINALFRLSVSDTGAIKSGLDRMRSANSRITGEAPPEVKSAVQSLIGFEDRIYGDVTVSPPRTNDLRSAAGDAGFQAALRRVGAYASQSCGYSGSSSSGSSSSGSSSSGSSTTCTTDVTGSTDSTCSSSSSSNSSSDTTPSTDTPPTT
jgi:hypothetical protein